MAIPSQDQSCLKPDMDQQKSKDSMAAGANRETPLSAQLSSGDRRPAGPASHPRNGSRIGGQDGTGDWSWRSDVACLTLFLSAGRRGP